MENIAALYYRIYIKNKEGIQISKEIQNLIFIKTVLSLSYDHQKSMLDVCFQSLHFTVKRCKEANVVCEILKAKLFAINKTLTVN